MDSQRRPLKDNNGNFKYKPPRRITADVEVVFGNNKLIHLTVLDDPPQTLREPSRRRRRP